jgi:hypothetical protein
MTQPAEENLEAEIQRLLAEDDRVAEQGITVHRREHLVVLDGEVESTERRDEICRRITARFPGVAIVCDIGITRTTMPAEVEEIS